MRLDFLVAALPLTRAVARGLPVKSVKTSDPKSDGPPYALQDDGPSYNPEGDGPRRIPRDSNRDGKVDITGDTDLAGKEKWTEESGALFLANIVDTDRRCSSQITGPCADKLADIFFLGTTLPEKPVLDPRIEQMIRLHTTEWEKKLTEYTKAYGELRGVDKRISFCHDASDDILRNSNYLAPLRTVSNPELSDSATGSIIVANEAAASNVRLFHKTGGQWTFVGRNYTFKAQDLKAGLELGIDGRDVRRPGGWDGRATVEVRVKDGAREAKDSVVLRVAPVLTQHHGQPAKQLLTATGYGGGGQQRFMEELRGISSKAGLNTSLHIFETSNCNQPDEIWAQDFFEPGYMSIPGSDGPISIHIYDTVGARLP
ncbi:peptidylarginine deiminase [Pochonia chlamydosporia 170]|uniref:Peptidylarginine deiminase n=1 Tax=Pochonia chlamydosporia 170 TaxID=1380566 RepID=A0A179FBF8_METCM|nr:peptidylarginine deiminase [Pochonia chlamydosporia 170]OAQ62640.2 peptidylarginine deiminase [Pochonia chlamydosporia 170]